ncbi:uncharacterized protein LOC134651722 [Cydia amplana]|uniref:uncharacterized protein LOC134651722 n=1 Tax=Cydia amplana TaxID=1869771 RepID=UPI002FE630F7
MFHLRLISAICIFAVFQHVVADAVSEECRTTYNNELSNDFLEGVWYEVAKYAYFGLLPSTSCGNNTIYKATDERLAAFELAYGVTISREDNPVLINYSEYSLNLLTGNIEAKDHYTQPGFALTQAVWNYRRLTDDFIMVWQCALRGTTIWVHSRINHPSDEEIAAATTDVPELSRMVIQRYCWA